MLGDQEGHIPYVDTANLIFLINDVYHTIGE